MTLVTGTKLGRYEIRSKLGAGGMGEVFLARDTSLNRNVALKILPSALASNEDRMRRFNQEATAAAALNHPHIAHIYEIGKQQDVQFIAMEYVDGETLGQKIHHRAPLTKLLKYLVQIAEGLTKAHSAGIVHRDLKPDNIMITRDDYAKILDFGLAKLLEHAKSELGSGSSSDIATAVMGQHSAPGTILGTVGYMSPEQAKGQVAEIDHRADIFSFGCILFEAVTGQKPFEGKDALDSLHKIVHAPIPQINDLNPAAPLELQRIVRRCLAKEPDKRYQSIKDVSLELDEIRQELNRLSELDYSVQPSSSLSTAQEPAKTERIQQTATESPALSRSTSSAEYLVNQIKQHKIAALLVLSVLVLCLVGLSFIAFRSIGRNRSTASNRSLKMTRLTSSGRVNQAAISPEGKYVAYSQVEGNKESLWLTQVAVANNTQIASPIETRYLGITFSKDATFIYITRRDKDNPNGALYQLPALGGNARKLLMNISSPVTFSPDGKQLAFVRCAGCMDRQAQSAIIITNADGSNEQELATQKAPELFTPGGPAWSPDGKVLACGVVHRQRDGYRNIVAIRLSDGVIQPITSQQWKGVGLSNLRLSWLSDNSGILASGAEQGSVSQIWYLAWPGDEARNITNDVNSYTQTSLTADSTTLAAVLDNRMINLWTASSQDMTGAKRITSGADRSDGERGISWTPDGKLVYCSRAGGEESIWMMNGDGSGNKQLSQPPLQNVEPVVSPDGRYVVWASGQSGSWELWRMDIDGNNPKMLSVGGYFQDISPDGQSVLYTPPNARMLKVSINGGTATQLTETPVLRPSISPDGKLIACNYRDKPGEEFKIGIFSFSGGPPIKVFDLLRSSRLIRWTPDGRSVAYVVTEEGVSNIWAQPLDGGPPKQLTDFKSENIFNFAWSRDGQKIALSRGVVNTDVVLITGFK